MTSEAPPLQLHLGHEFLLLYLDDRLGKGDLSAPRLGCAYAGALVAEWSFAGRLGVARADHYRILDRQSSWPSIRAALACVPGDAPRTQQGLIRAICSWDPDSRWDLALAELQGLGLLQPVADTFLGLHWRTRWPMVDGRAEAIVIERLRHHVDRRVTAPHLDDALLSVLRATGQLDKVWTKEELPDRRDAIVRCTERAPIGRQVRAVASTLDADFLTVST